MFIEINRGHCFKSLARYCLNDIGRSTNHRVAFTETRNLATSNADAAWRIMASRSYVRDELKRKAGVAPQGRRDGKPVGHLIISWSEEEARSQSLSKEGMLQAVDGALNAIDANLHHALIIAHRDTDNPHCHVIIDLVSEDGRLKKNWQEKRRLSKFALQHEMSVHGKPLVAKRAANWVRRDTGQAIRSVKKVPRPQFELERLAEEDCQLAARARKIIDQDAKLRAMRKSHVTRHARHRDWLERVSKERQRRLRGLHQLKLQRIRDADSIETTATWMKWLNAFAEGQAILQSVIRMLFVCDLKRLAARERLKAAEMQRWREERLQEQARYKAKCHRMQHRQTATIKTLRERQRRNRNDRASLLRQYRRPGKRDEPRVSVDPGHEAEFTPTKTLAAEFEIVSLNDEASLAKKPRERKRRPRSKATSRRKRDARPREANSNDRLHSSDAIALNAQVQSASL